MHLVGLICEITLLTRFGAWSLVKVKRATVHMLISKEKKEKKKNLNTYYKK